LDSFSFSLRSALFLGLLAGGPAAVWCVQSWAGRLAFRIGKPDGCVLTAQVFLPHHNGLYVYHRHRPRRNLLCIATERFHLHMGCRKCWAKVRQVFWLCRRLVVDHGLDDVHSQQLSSKGNLFSRLGWPCSTLTREIRPQRTTSCRSSQSGRSTFLVAPETTTSNGARSSGGSPR
jgi:hypothetical protein